MHKDFTNRDMIRCRIIRK